MIFSETPFALNDGRPALLRSPGPDDAAEMLDFITKASGETEFLLKYPEEFADYTLEREEGFLRSTEQSPDQTMIACYVDGRIAGNCQIAFHPGMKERHRASVAIALLREYWGLGIGTEMFRAMIRLAEEREGVRQIELDFIEGNDRARHLYEKLGFRITGVKPDAIRFRDGRFANEYMMVKKL